MFKIIAVALCAATEMFASHEESPITETFTNEAIEEPATTTQAVVKNILAKNTEMYYVKRNTLTSTRKAWAIYYTRYCMPRWSYMINEAKCIRTRMQNRFGGHWQTLVATSFGWNGMVPGGWVWIKYGTKHVLVWKTK